MTDYNGETATDEAGRVTMARGWSRSTRAMGPGRLLACQIVSAHLAAMNCLTRPAGPARRDSMEPTIRDGDILLLDFDISRQDVANGGVSVVTIDGNLFVKRLQIMLDGAIQILSDNERYEPEIVDREYAGDKMHVHARVVWTGGPLR